jgi:hypothetical protein
LPKVACSRDSRSSFLLDDHQVIKKDSLAFDREPVAQLVEQRPFNPNSGKNRKRYETTAYADK